MESRPADEMLVRQIAASDEDALAALYDRYGRLVYSVALHIAGSQPGAEEITLDVFHTVWRKAATYRPERAKVSTWLTMMARSRAIDRLRREGARPHRDSINLAAIQYQLAAPSANPETAVALTMRQERVQAALDELPDEQRQVVDLAYFAGLSHSQIANHLDLPLGTVKTRIRLAMQKLAQTLAGG